MSKDSGFNEILDIPRTGLLRISQVLRFVPISKSSWWKGVKDGLYPQPVKLSARVTCWRAEDIRALIEKLKKGDGNEN